MPFSATCPLLLPLPFAAPFPFTGPSACSSIPETALTSPPECRLCGPGVSTAARRAQRGDGGAHTVDLSRRQRVIEGQRDNLLECGVRVREVVVLVDEPSEVR